MLITSSFLIKGSSSLLFIISTVKAFYCSNLISWKLFNVLLIGASFLCNATEYKNIFLLLDYFAIYLVCTSYINNIYINIPYSLLLIYEFNTSKSIIKIKNLAYVTAIGKSIVYTYLYVDDFHFFIIFTSATVGIVVYKIRSYFHENYNKKYTLLLTYLLHICTMNIIYIASITAVYPPRKIE